MSNYQTYKSIDKLNIDLSINNDEVFRYLGYKNTVVDDETKKTLEFCISEIKEISEMKYIFDVFLIEKKLESLVLQDSIIELTGKDIFKHLKTSKKCAIMAATLGTEVDRRIKYYSLVDLTKGVIFDACATALIESLCDYVEGEIKIIATKEDYNITSRYSPGYGDLNINIQQSILNTLNTQKYIGLNATDSSILLPRKSVTAFIGFTKEKSLAMRKCIDCNLYGSCSYSKGGEYNCAR